MLLLVDNCEHVVDAAAVLIDDILSRCPGITVLATSREALAIPDEVQVTVGPLGTPPGHTAPGQVLSYPGGTAVRRTSSRGAPRVGVRRAEPDRDRRDHPVPRRHPARGRAGCGPGDVVVAVHQGVAVAGLGRCHEAAGDLSAAQDRYQEALDLGRRLGEPSVTASALEGSARVALSAGDRATATARWVEAAGIRERFHRPPPPHEQDTLRGLADAL
jgi:hypothetical protein